MSLLNLVSLGGWCVLCLLAWSIGGCRREVSWRTVLGSTALTFGLAGAIFLLPPVRSALLLVNRAVLVLIGASRAGAEFLFGPLALGPGESTAAGESSIGVVLAAQVLPAVIFFASLMALMHHLGLVAPVVRIFARLFHRSLRLSGAEGLAGALHIFFGVETAAAIEPYLKRMTRSELLTVLSTNLATTASTTLAIYVVLLQDSFPRIAGHLLSASLLSIPCTVLVTKLMLPERDAPETFGAVPRLDSMPTEDNPVAALASGAMAGLRIAAGIAAILIAVLGVVALVDALLALLPAALGGGEAPPTLAGVLGGLFTPFAWLLGIEPADLSEAARLLGQRLVLTEVVSYQDLGQMADSGELSPRSILVLSYALCGFAHVAGVGVALGGFGALASERLGDLGQLALRALVAATIATLLTGCVAGFFYYGQQGVLGL